jgi:hypothetical protein
MPPNKKARPLHVSLYHIEQERSNVQLRTQARIATLLASSITTDEPRVEVGTCHCRQEAMQNSCLSPKVLVLCFCSLLLTLNLLFLQWAYIEVTLHVEQV